MTGAFDVFRHCFCCLGFCDQDKCRQVRRADAIAVTEACLGRHFRCNFRKERFSAGVWGQIGFASVFCEGREKRTGHAASQRSAYRAMQIECGFCDTALLCSAYCRIMSDGDRGGAASGHRPSWIACVSAGFSSMVFFLKRVEQIKQLHFRMDAHLLIDVVGMGLYGSDGDEKVLRYIESCSAL